MADIESIFLQVRMPLKDANALRFLWWPNSDLQSEPEEYQILIYLFDATSLPRCAFFALRQTGEDNKNDFNQVTVKTVHRNFYMNDCLKSVETEEKANKLQEKLQRLLSRGGFHLSCSATWRSVDLALVAYASILLVNSLQKVNHSSVKFNLKLES